MLKVDADDALIYCDNNCTKDECTIAHDRAHKSYSLHRSLFRGTLAQQVLSFLKAQRQRLQVVSCHSDSAMAAVRAGERRGQSRARVIESAMKLGDMLGCWHTPTILPLQSAGHAGKAECATAGWLIYRARADLPTPVSADHDTI